MPGDRKHHTDKFRSCVEQVMAKGESEDSAYAICTTSLQKAGEAIFEAAAGRHLHLLGATGTARTDYSDGKEYLVVPVVALMEGVIHAVNAETPEFVPQACLERAAASWNGKPLVLYHPKKAGKQCSANSPEVLAEHGIGFIRNSRMSGAKLLQEAWVEKARAKQLHPAMYEDLEANKSVEVSVGAFVVTDDAAGTHGSKAYKASWLTAVGDHLALLPGGRGACSMEMGCGAHRAAGHFVAAESITWEGDMLKDQVAAFFRALMPRGWGDDEVKADLRDALHAIEPGARNGEILRVTNDAIVYCVYPPVPPSNVYDANPMPWPSKMTYWKRGYTFDTATRTFTLSPERVQVEPATVYETLKGLKGKPAYKDCPACDGSGSKDGNPCEACDGNGEMKIASASAAKVIQPKPPVVKKPAAAATPQLKAASCGCASTCTCHKGDRTMAEKPTRAEMIAALTTDRFSGFNEGDVALLETASEARLEEFRAASSERQIQATAHARLESDHRNAQASLKVNAERLRTAEEPPTEEAWLAKAPAHIKALLDAHKAEEDVYRASMIVQLKDLGANTEDELKAKSTKELETLSRYARVTVPDFSGRALPVTRTAAAHNNDYAPPNPYEAGIKAAQAKVN